MPCQRLANLASSFTISTFALNMRINYRNHKPKIVRIFFLLILVVCTHWIRRSCHDGIAIWIVNVALIALSIPHDMHNSLWFIVVIAWIQHCNGNLLHLTSANEHEKHSSVVGNELDWSRFWCITLARRSRRSAKSTWRPKKKTWRDKLHAKKYCWT